MCRKHGGPLKNLDSTQILQEQKCVLLAYFIFIRSVNSSAIWKLSALIYLWHIQSPLKAVDSFVLCCWGCRNDYKLPLELAVLFTVGISSFAADANCLFFLEAPEGTLCRWVFICAVFHIVQQSGLANANDDWKKLNNAWISCTIALHCIWKCIVYCKLKLLEKNNPIKAH